MRYFFSLARTETTLSFGIPLSAISGCTIAFGCPAQRCRTCMVGATISAIDLASIAMTANKDLAMATRAVK